ncbi:acyl-CoA thioesterase [Arenicella xantha]|nr:acyl-CoA thioesterase II [Arenicella xantha]
MSSDQSSDTSLLHFLNCEALDLNLFRGQSRDFKTGQVYGGQVLGQAIKAAYQTTDGTRGIHSAHAYFLLRGDVDAPIIYEVDRSLDGGSFSSRRVVAIQHGRQIFHLSASFQKHEEGLEYSEKWQPPFELLQQALDKGITEETNFQSEYLDVWYVPHEQATRRDSTQYWFKTKEALPDDLATHHTVLAYISDMGPLEATVEPHSLNAPKLEDRHKKVMLATIDHAIWFHRPFRADDWLFYECRAQSTGNGRGLAYGRIYTKDGTLVASTSQEGLLRIRR